MEKLGHNFSFLRVDPLHSVRAEWRVSGISIGPSLGTGPDRSDHIDHHAVPKPDNVVASEVVCTAEFQLSYFDVSKRIAVTSIDSNFFCPLNYSNSLSMKKLFLFFITLFIFLNTAYADVNINTATQAELETLHGIGPAKAKAIIEYRKKKGPFKTPGDLEKVRGIGPATMKRLRSEITVGELPKARKENKIPAR
jgi:competence protein ComEA